MELLNENEKEYWKTLKVSPEELEELYEKDWHKKFKEILKNNENHLNIISSFLKVEKINIDDIKNLKEISKTKNAIILYALQKYITNKIYLLIDFLKEVKETYTFTDINNPLISILELYSQSKEQVQNSNFYYIANKIPCLEELIFRQVDKDFLERFEKEGGVSIVPFLKNKLNKKSYLSYTFQIGTNFYFFYERAKENKVYEGYKKRISLLSKSNIVLHFNLLKKTLRVITHDPRVHEVLSNFSEKNRIQFEMVSPLEIEENFSDKFKNIFIEEIENFEIRKINFNRLGKNTFCKATFEQSQNQEPLNKILVNLIQDNFIDPSDIRKFNLFKASLNGFEFTIYVLKEGDFITLKLKEELISETKKKEIFDFFKDSFSIILNADYYTKKISIEERKNILCGLLGKFTTQMTKKEEVVYREIRKYDIFNTTRIPIYKCSSNPTHIIPDGEEIMCPMCKNSLLVYSPREKIILDDKKLISFLQNKMEKIYGKNVVSLKNISKDKPLIYVKNVKSNFIIYPYLYGSIKDKIEKLNNLEVPVVQVVIDKKAPTYEYDLTSQLYLYDFLYDDLKKIKKELEEVTIFKSEKKLIEDCNKSLAVLKEILEGKEISDLIPNMEKGDAFEEICYPLLKRIFIKIIHWGRKRRFKTIPDGVFGIKMSSVKSHAFSMLYDFKYSDKNYDINKRQIRDYITQANQSQEIKKFSEELSAFLILSHNLTDKKFKNTANTCYRSRKWKRGKCIKMEINCLLHLYKKISEINEFDEYKKIAVNLAFANFIKKLKKDRTIILTIQDIDSILEEGNKIGQDLNTENLYNHLVNDEIF